MFRRYLVTIEVSEASPDAKEKQAAKVERRTVTAGSAEHAEKMAEKYGKVIKVEAK